MSHLKELISNNKLFLFLAGIFLLGAVLRFYSLGSVPVGFHRDEAFLGYNAYSILQTGKDITGNFLPVHLESFLYSPAGYSYFSIPFIFLFGLSEFSIRFASALFGSLTIIITFFLVRNLFQNYEKIEILALFSSFFLAISPWHITLSRVSTESTIVVFFLSLGVLFYTYWVRQGKKLFFFASIFSFAITLLTYQAPRAFLPLFLPLLFIVFFKSKKKFALSVTALFIAVIIPVILILSSYNLSERIRMLSILQHPGTQLILNEQIREDGTSDTPLILTRAFHNKPVGYLNTFSQNYFKHFSYDFLFTDAGLPDRYRVNMMGLLYFFEIPLLLFGIYRLIHLKKEGLFIIGWILLVPLGTALTFDDVPNLQRTLLIFPALSMVSALGFMEISNLIKKIRIKKLFYTVSLVVFIYFLSFYLHQYYVHQINHRPWYRQEGYKELVEKVNGLSPKYQKIIITDFESAPEIFFLFFNKYDPSRYQKETTKFRGREYKNWSFDKYRFVSYCALGSKFVWDPIAKKDIEVVRGEKNVLYINHSECREVTKNVEVIDEIKRNDGTLVFKILEYKKNVK